MPLTLPNLDDRRWAELAEEGRALLPYYAPEWTDHNAHDPGVTLLELFAWLTEMDIYQLNRVTERNKLKFLSLVGVHLEPPRASLTVMSLTPKPGQTAVIPASVEFEGKDTAGQVVRFSSLDDLNVVQIELQSILREDRNGVHDLTSRWRRGETIALFGDEPHPGAAFYLGFKRALPQGAPVTLFFVARDLRESEVERGRIIEEIAARDAACRAPELCLMNGEASRLERAGQLAKLSHYHHSARVVWEYFGDSQTWRRLETDSGRITDETRAFTLNGRVVINVGSMMARKRIAQSEELYFLRCRLLTGDFDAAPQTQALVINGALAEQSVATGEWREFQTPSGVLKIEVEDLGKGAGRPNQRLNIGRPAALASGFRLFTFENGEWREWTRRHDFDASRRADAHFLLDPVAGVVIFGDGEKGRVVPRGAQVIAAYRSTRAEAGNIAAGAVTKLAETTHNRTLPGFDLGAVKESLAAIANPVAAAGGAAAESFVHAAGRAFDSVETTPRAVTLEDYERLARATPGARLARVSARANLRAGFQCLAAPGMITVIILPYLPKDRPAPSFELRQAVAAYLSRRRVIGARVEVVGPTYREVTVRARAQSCSGANRAEARQRIAAALDRFFHPLIGGPDGAGWPFGRDVYRSEVLQTIDETPGVDHALSLELVVDGQAHCGNVCLGALELVAAGRHQIEVL
jgi:predicted phage baseplate assembly protein